MKILKFLVYNQLILTNSQKEAVQIENHLQKYTKVWKMTLNKFKIILKLIINNKISYKNFQTLKMISITKIK